MFYGLRSRCMIFLECISFSPLRMEWIAVLISCGLNLYLALTLSQSCPPSSSSTTIYSEFQDQNTSKSRMQFLWLRFLMISISLMRHSFPLSSEYAAYLEKAFTAQLLPSSNFSARQTEAKFPLPIFFLGLNCSWKPRWLSLALRRSRHCCRSEDDRRLQVLFCQFFSKVTEGGEGRQENLTSKSKARKVLDLREDSMRQRQQMATVTSPSSWRWAWQVVRSLPVGLGAVWEQRESEISIGLQYVIKKSGCNSSIA